MCLMLVSCWRFVICVMLLIILFFFFFFFQAEDGIRDVAVTGVQTCALPIFVNKDVETLDVLINNAGVAIYDDLSNADAIEQHLAVNFLGMFKVTRAFLPRSEERRVGKECMSGWWRESCRGEGVIWEIGR